MSKENGYKDQCGSCIYLNIDKPHGCIGFECENKNIKHTHLGYIRYKHSPACKKGYETKEGFKFPQTKNKTWFNDETLAKHDREVIEEFCEKLLDHIRLDDTYTGAMILGIIESEEFGDEWEAER